MASWSKDRVEPNAINGGREFTRDDNLALNELNAIVNNSFYASEKSAEALGKINDIIEHEQGTVVTINDSPQAEWKADFAESERQKSKNLWNSELQIGAYIFTDGVYYGDFNYACNKTLISVEPNKTITLSCKGIDLPVSSGFVFFKDGVYVSGHGGITTATVPANANQVAYNFYSENIGYNLSKITDIQLEYGNTATEYQAYNGAIVHEKDVPLPLKAQMICRLNSNQIVGTGISYPILFDNITTIGNSGLITFDNGTFKFDNSIKYYRIYGGIQVSGVTSGIDYNIAGTPSGSRSPFVDTFPNSNVATASINSPLMENTGENTPKIYIAEGPNGEISSWYSYLVVEVY